MYGTCSKGTSHKEAGDDKYGGLRTGYYLEANAAIIMYDQQSNVGAIEQWIRDVRAVNGNMAIVIVASKCDINSKNIGKKLSDDYHKFIGPRFRKVPFYQLSNVSNYNLEKPFLAILRHLTHCSDLNIV